MILEHGSVKIDFAPKNYGSIIYLEGCSPIISSDTGIRVIKQLPQWIWERAMHDNPDRIHEYLNDFRKIVAPYLYDDEMAKQLSKKLVKMILQITNSTDFIVSAE